MTSSRAPLLALALLVGCGTGEEPPRGPARASRSAAPPAAAAIPADAPRVVFLGDSISAGLHLAADEAFPAVLQRLLAEEGRPFHLVNAGVSGDTSAGGRERLAWILRQEPAVVVVELGANDGLRGQPVDAIEQNLRAILLDVREAGARPLLLGMRLPPSYGAEYVQAFEALYARLAGELGVPFVPFFMQDVAGVPEHNLPDGLHPSAEGHAILARNVLDALAGVLDEVDG